LDLSFQIKNRCSVAICSIFCFLFSSALLLSSRSPFLFLYFFYLPLTSASPFDFCLLLLLLLLSLRSTYFVIAKSIKGAEHRGEGKKKKSDNYKATSQHNHITITPTHQHTNKEPWLI